MMDMGGTPMVKTQTKLDFSKNSKVRAVCLDFDLFIRSIESNMDYNLNNTKSNQERNHNKNDSNTNTTTSIVEDIASLFNMKVNKNKIVKTTNSKDNEDDLSNITGSRNKRISNPTPTIMKPHTPKDLTENTIKAPPASPDIRLKYASKLRKKLPTEMGSSVGSLDLAKSEISDNNTIKDSDFHLNARKIVMSNTITTNKNIKSDTKWLANAGAGKLLSFLMSRSMKIVLLPIPKNNILSPNNSVSTHNEGQQKQQMEDLAKQLPNIHFHELIHRGDNAKTILSQFLNNLKYDSSSQKKDDIISTAPISSILPKHCLIVSDRDDYLKMAKEMNMFTCRVRPENARRGNITAAYNVLEIGMVEDIINEINGISFNSVFGAR